MTTNLRELLEAGVHFGHQSRFWHPKMAPYIYGERNGIHIINLEKTLEKINTTLEHIRQLILLKKKILLVSTKRQSSAFVEKYAQQVDIPYVNHRWLGGMLTNFKTVRASVLRLQEMKDKLPIVEMTLTKKEVLLYKRTLAKLERDLGGIVNLTSIPDVLFIIDVGYHKIAVSEAKKLGLEIIGVVDTNHNPNDIDHIIPGNDDSSLAIELYLRLITHKIAETKEEIIKNLVVSLKDDGEVVENEEPITQTPNK
ncbi:MAG: 30S ribosomal protein S2 [Gammaproteobacteria bacterium]|nr:30S ribosomal protein S2 [Gammaproteobacteria bacterium]